MWNNSYILLSRFSCKKRKKKKIFLRFLRNFLQIFIPDSPLRFVLNLFLNFLGSPPRSPSEFVSLLQPDCLPVPSQPRWCRIRLLCSISSPGFSGGLIRNGRLYQFLQKFFESLVHKSLFFGSFLEKLLQLFFSSCPEKCQ